MTQHAVVMRGSAPRDEADARGAVTVDGTKLPRAIPADNVTATVTNPNPPQIALPTNASTADESRTFLENVLVWPADPNSPLGWINVHVNVKNKNPSDVSAKNNSGKPWVVGWPFKTVDDVLDRINWTESTTDFFNVWVCMSQQSECTQKANGKPKAVRKAANATWLKAIWIDCDVKPGDAKHYHTMPEAFDALDAFRDKVGLPFPSMIVNSGGGLHVYWVSHTPMSVDDWRPYADGLKSLLLREGVKCDTGLTTDAARILRVPGTLNHKYNPPRPVELLHLHQAYDFAKDLAFLTQVSAAVTATVNKPRGERDVIVPATEGGSAFDAPDPAFSMLNTHDTSLQRICEPIGLHLVDPRPVFGKDGCGFLREALRTGGHDYDNPKWNLSVLCAAFMENGNVIAHEISKGHAAYRKEDTQALYDRKIADRADRGIGYPSCAAIAGVGSEHCKTCPHFVKGKSPLNIRANITTVSPSAPIDVVAAINDRPVTRDEPEFSNLDAPWLTAIFDGDTKGTYGGDRSRLAFAVACELVRAGLDDNFIARVLMTAKCGEHVQESPARRLERTIARAHEFSIDPDLEEMNSNHAVLPIGDKTRVVTWGADCNFSGRKTIVRAQTFQDFANLYSNRRKIIEKIDADGNPTQKKVPIGEWWLRHERRRQYNGGQKFMPQHDAEVVDDALNMYNGFAVHSRKPEGGSGASGCRLFLKHGFEVICNGNEEHWDYLLKREAWIVQNRRRSEIAAAYRTEAEGSGKGFWCTHLGHLFGQHFMQVSNPDHVIGKHNPHLETLIKLCADEALFVGDPRHRNALFSMITEPTLTIEPKFVGAYKATNHLNIDITTNAKHFVPASRTARRFFIPTVSENRVGDLEYFKRMENQLKDGGYEALLYHLLNEVDLRDFDVRRVPKTAGLAEQVEYSRKGLDGLIEKICSEGRVPCAHGHWPGFSISNGSEIKQGFDYFIDTHHDRELRDLQALKVKRQLRRDWGCLAGDEAKRRDAGDMIYGVKWPPLAGLREKFVKRHGPQEWLHPEVTEWPVLASAQALNAQHLPPRIHPVDRTVTVSASHSSSRTTSSVANVTPSRPDAPPPAPSEAALIAKEIDAADRFVASRRR